MKSNFRTFIQTELGQVKQSTEAYLLNVEGDMALKTVLTQYIRGMWARITELLDRVRRDFSDSGEGPSWQ